MNVLNLSIKNIKSKPFYTFLGVFILALSIALLLGVQQLRSSFAHQMDNNLAEIDMVVGAKGSPLQLVLASVLHLDDPTGNIPYQTAINLGKNPLVKRAVPISYGDNYKGFRIVGTTEEFLELYEAPLAEGRPAEKAFEVVLGSALAQQLDMGIGATFLSSHGLVENEVDLHDNEFLVVGILAPTQKVIDRLILTQLTSIWDAHNHKEEPTDHEQHEQEHEDQREITSLLVSFRSPAALLMLPRQINDNTIMQAALPKFELDRLLEFTGIGIKTVSLIAYLILAISALTIFLNLYKMVKDRAFDLALFRTYGASNFQLIKMLGYEGLFIAIAAFIIGFVFVKFWLYSAVELMDTKVQKNFLQDLQLQDVWQVGILVVIMIMAAVLFAIYPIFKMNISTILSNEK